MLISRNIPDAVMTSSKEQKIYFISQASKSIPLLCDPAGVKASRLPAEQEM